MRFMLLMNCPRDVEKHLAGWSRAELQAHVEFMHKLNEQLKQSGELLLAEGLEMPTAARIVRWQKAGPPTVTDGPFTESKELIASYALFEVKSMAEAVEWTTRFLKALGEGECEIRPLFEASDFPPESFPPAEAAREKANRKQMKKNAARR